VIDLRWTPQSLHDLETIRAYIAEDSSVYADLTLQRIVTAVERLRSFPDSGRMVPECRTPEVREVIVGNYRVVYRRSAGCIEVVTVFRGSREFPQI